MAKLMMDYADLRAEMIRKGLKIYEVADKTGIGLSTLTLKLRKGIPFSGEQIYSLAEVLDISLDKFGHYFFRVKV